MIQSNQQIYVDNAASTPVRDEVVAAMQPFLQTVFGNPSSIHKCGIYARRNIDEARERIAYCLKCHPDELYFTSGGTESNNWAIFGMAMASEKKELITSQIEHRSVLNAIKALERFAYKAAYLKTNSFGEVVPEELETLINLNTALITVMLANNETGVLQPVDKISELAHWHNIPFFSDAVQAIGNVELDLSKGLFDAMSFSGHKLGGPKGIGILYLRRGTKIEPFLHGGGQERGYRGGTENVPGIMGLATAVELAINDLKKKQSVQSIKLRLLEALHDIPMAHLSGRLDNTLPGTLHICFDYVDGSDLVRYLSMNGIFASSSSACASNAKEPSHVLLAMGIPYELARGALRISLNERNTIDEVLYLAHVLKTAVSTLRSMNAEYRNMYMKK